jgi:hypothetical protein
MEKTCKAILEEILTANFRGGTNTSRLLYGYLSAFGREG